MSTSDLKNVPTTEAKVVNSKNGLFTFYDIESLKNIFTVAVYTPKFKRVDVFYLVDDENIEHDIDIKKAASITRERNPAYGDGRVFFHNLKEETSNLLLLSIFGVNHKELSYDIPASEKFTGNDTLGLVQDIDKEYNPIWEKPGDTAHPYLAGYNSFNYDTTMLAIYIHEVTHGYITGNPQPGFTPTSAHVMRTHNDEIFTNHKDRMPGYLRTFSGDWNSDVNQIRYGMINSGRYIDVARLNEKQAMVGLKRLCGMLGFQILESDKLSGPDAFIESVDDFYELAAYNTSDVINLDKLFQHKTYRSAFDLKKGLLDRYPETVYPQIRGTERPNLRAREVRRMRLTVDSSSAQFVAYILAPYQPLQDIPAVSFQYPAPGTLDENGQEITPVNVLDQCLEFFEANVKSPDARAAFRNVYDYYKSIEGRNFNERLESDVYTFGDIPVKPMNIPYFTRDGRPTPCFVTFSTGGIHGAELNTEFFNAEKEIAERKTREFNAQLLAVKSQFPDATEFRKACSAQPRGQTAWLKLNNGMIVEHKNVLAPGSTIKKGCTYREEKHIETELFATRPNGSNYVKKKHSFTSVSDTIHEDFSSYYPNLLRNMQAFRNKALGEDRYATIYEEKQRFGKLEKDMSIPKEQRDFYNVLREGTKLILNTASGAGDASHDTNIRMNNQIISMRIIGQLFSWRIGQAQTFEGAQIISTNTDGLYSVLDEAVNQKVLDEQGKAIRVDIEPEKMILVSKDSNNRLEIFGALKNSDTYERFSIDEALSGDPAKSAIKTASGGSLACWAGPRPDKSLAHPAIIDYILVHYLRLIAIGYQPEYRNTPLSITEDFDEHVGQEILKQAEQEFDKPHLLRMYQNVIAASDGTMTFPFACEWEEEIGDISQFANPQALQHYNRVFITKKKTPGAVSLRYIRMRKVTPASLNKRKEDATKDPTIALYNRGNSAQRDLLEKYGLSYNSQKIRDGLSKAPQDRDLAITRITGIDPTWPMVIINDDLEHLGERLDTVIDSLDVETYLSIAASGYRDNWMNRTADSLLNPSSEDSDTSDKTQENSGETSQDTQ